MKKKDMIPIMEQLDRIEKKIDGKTRDKFLSIDKVASLTSLSTSTIRREVKKGYLKCSRRLGKLLFQESDVRKWLNG